MRLIYGGVEVEGRFVLRDLRDVERLVPGCNMADPLLNLGEIQGLAWVMLRKSHPGVTPDQAMGALEETIASGKSLGKIQTELIDDLRQCYGTVLPEHEVATEGGK